jgi:hypothetical protein
MISPEAVLEYHNRVTIPIMRDYFHTFISPNATAQDLAGLDFNGLIQMAQLIELRDIRKALESR